VDGLTERGQAMGGLPVTGPVLGWELRALFDALGEVAASQRLGAARQQRIEETLTRIEEKLMSQQDIDAAVAAMNAARDDMNRVAAQIGSATPPPPPDDTTALAQATADLGAAQAGLDAAVPAEVAP